MAGEKASALWHPCLPYWISPLPVSKSGENAHDKRHPMPRSSLVALRVTRWHALAHRLGGSSRRQAHLDVRYRLIQRPAIETPRRYNKPIHIEPDRFRNWRSLWCYMMTSRVCDTWFNADLERSEPAWKIGGQMSECASTGTLREERGAKLHYLVWATGMLRNSPVPAKGTEM